MSCLCLVVQYNVIITVFTECIAVQWLVCAGVECSTCCDTCCSTCSSTQPSDAADTKQHPSKSSLQGSAGRSASARTPSSPFKIFRDSSAHLSDTEDDSMEDSSNTLSRTPPYAGVDVEEVEMPSTEDDKDAGDDAAAGTAEVEVDGPQRRTTSAVSVTGEEDTLLLMPPSSYTADTLFGEMSDSESEPSRGGPPATDNPAADGNFAVTSTKTSAVTKLPAADVEDGEITDSDSESVTASPSDVRPGVANKENAVVNVSSVRQTDAKQAVCNKQQNTSMKLPGRSDCAKPSQSTSHSPPRRRTSSDRDRNPSSGNKSRLGSGGQCDDRNRSPQFARSRGSSGDRKERPAVRDNVDARRDETATAKSRSPGRTNEHRFNSGAPRGLDRRLLSPRKNTARSRSVHRSSADSAKSSFRSRRTAAARFVRPARRF